MFSDRALSMEKVDFHFIIQSTSYQRVSYSRCLKIQLKTVAIRVDEMMCSPDFVVLLVWYDVNGEAVRVLENHQTKNLTCFIQQLTEKKHATLEKRQMLYTHCTIVAKITLVLLLWRTRVFVVRLYILYHHQSHTLLLCPV